MAETESPRFDALLRDLEQTVERLESGELALEDSLAAFERGVALVRTLHERLAAVEQRIEVLMRDGEGTLRVRPLEPEQE